MKVLFFAAHAGVWQHAFPEALVADAIRAGGAEVVYITCGGAFGEYCITMGARGVPMNADAATKRAVCDMCQASRDRLRAGFVFRGHDLESALTPADHTRIDKILAAADPEAIISLEVDGIGIGRLSLYEFMIERKKLQFELTPEEWTVFRPRLANALRSLLAAQRILEREKPDRVVTYNSLYSVNAAWRAVADQRGIPFYFLHGGLSVHQRLQRIFLGRDSTLDWWNRIVAAWPRYRDSPCSAAELAEVTEHYVRMFRGASVFAYSAPKSAAGVDVRKRFGVGADQKLLVASMSSYDEYVAAAVVGGVPDQSTLLFPTQIEWIRALTAWMRTRPDLFLLIRVHPREFPNQREGLKSEHAKALELEFAELPPNVKVNWPTDKLSIYDVAEQADAFLNAWSTAGKEMTLLGLPVVTYCPTALQYPPELNYVGTTKETYFAAIDEALRDGWSFDRVRKAYRWCVLEYSRGLVDISDAFDLSEEPARSTLDRVRNLVLSRPQIRQRYDLLRRPRSLRNQHRLAEAVLRGDDTLLEPPVPATVEEETAALRTEVGRLVQALYGNAPAFDGQRLRHNLKSVAAKSFD